MKNGNKKIIPIEDMNEKLNNFKLEYNKTVNEIQNLKSETEKIKAQMIGNKTLEWESRNKNKGLPEFPA